jgi:predicted MPP superfamily phosphohydrolase
MKNRVFISDVRVVYTVGDLHGDYESFKKVLKEFERSEKGSLLLFLGDYADRGIKGVEIITELNGLLEDRKDIIALKGNHEQYKDGVPIFSPCDLIYEAEKKYGSWKRFYNDVMVGFVRKLYIAAMINNVLFVHAGISSVIKDVEALSKVDNETILLWSDPSELSGEYPNIRGAGITFGEDITRKVLSSLRLRMIVRSHEPKKAAYGPAIEHGGRVITTNACASYGEPWRPFVLRVDTVDLQYEPIFL